MSRAFFRWNVLDAHGRAIVDAQVEVFEAGTTTPVDVYGATTGGSPLTQPLATTGQGEIVGYVDQAQQLDLRVSDGGDTAYFAVDSGAVADFPTFTETVDAMPAASDIPSLGFDQEWTGTQSFADAVFANGPHANPRHPIYGAVGSGAVDDTTAIQSALDASQRVYIPAGSYRISTPLTPQDGSVVVMDPDARLWFAPGVSGGLPIFDLDGAVDVWIDGGELDGNKIANPTPASGLYGVQVTGSAQRVTLNRVRAHDFGSSTATGGNGGDGFYVGKTGANIPDDIRFVDCVSHDNVRQGWSIVAGTRIRIDRPTAYGITGTSGGNGIDIEPAAAITCDQIEVNHPVIYACSKGMQVGNNMTGRVTINSPQIRDITDATNGHGIEVGNGTGPVLITNPLIEDCILDGITLGTNPGVNIIGGTIRSCGRYGTRMQGPRQSATGVTIEADVNNCVRLENAAANCRVTGCSFYVTANVGAVRSESSNDHVIAANAMFATSTGAAVRVGGTSTGVLVASNRADGFTTGLDLTAGTSVNRAYGNDFTGCTTPVADAGTNNVVIGSHGVTGEFRVAAKMLVTGEAELDGALNHDGTTLGLLGATPATQAAKINDPAGGATVDTEARAAVAALIDVLERFGLSAP